MRNLRTAIALAAGLILLAICASAGNGPITTGSSSLVIPKVQRPPKIEDFLTMEANAEMAAQMARVEGFIQRDPKDGEPVTEKTIAYTGYDDKNLYVVFVCFDDPQHVRARMARREDIYSDDTVQVMIDTFHDQRRAYSFVVNALGIQLDRLYTEQNGMDDSFDTLWDTQGKLTDKGYVVWMSIPFKSLRFPSAPSQIWGILFQRIIQRDNETAFWPHVSAKITGRMNQAATMTGLQNISPGRNIQLIPYGVFRSFRALDTSDPVIPKFTSKRGEFTGGVDAKMVLKDAFVLDATLNPDFSQVESDEPQTTVNQRFEVFFPERRPFFLENASYFQTPIDLYFTRRIADPLYGLRLTGKKGRNAIGMLFADDESPGRSVLPGDPLRGTDAYFGIGRYNRDIFKESTIGVVYATRQYQNDYNHVGGVDTRLKWKKIWTFEGQAVTSSTSESGTYSAGPAYQMWMERASRKIVFNTYYEDNAPGFINRTGFFRRPDFRRFSNFFRYQFRPEGKHLVSFGPNFFQMAVWDHKNNRLEDWYNYNFYFSFKRQTEFGMFNGRGHEMLRPGDADNVVRNTDFHTQNIGFYTYTEYFRQVHLFSEIIWANRINYGPGGTQAPYLTDRNSVYTELTLRPITNLSIANTYILTRYRKRDVNQSIFNNHILRSKWNYQITRELSVRFIADYQSVLPYPGNTSLEKTKQFNVDFLVTYLVHPGTAIYVGYNSNLQNIDPALCARLGTGACDPAGPGLLRTPNGFINDGKQLFVKASYLFRF